MYQTSLPDQDASPQLRKSPRLDNGTDDETDSCDDEATQLNLDTFLLQYAVKPFDLTGIWCRVIKNSCYYGATSESH